MKRVGCVLNELNVVMSLIDQEEDAPPVVQNIVLLENKHEEEEKKNEVEIEEIMEEELMDPKDPKEQDEGMEIRKRHVKEEK